MIDQNYSDFKKNRDFPLAYLNRLGKFKSFATQANLICKGAAQGCNPFKIIRGNLNPSYFEQQWSTE